MVRVLGYKVEGPRFESDNFILVFFSRACDEFFCNFFCVNLTYASTHASNLRKNGKSYNERNLDAQRAHVARLRRYCAQKKVAQYRRKISALWFVGYAQQSFSIPDGVHQFAERYVECH